MKKTGRILFFRTGLFFIAAIKSLRACGDFFGFLVVHSRNRKVKFWAGKGGHKIVRLQDQAQLFVIACIRLVGLDIVDWLVFL